MFWCHFHHFKWHLEADADLPQCRSLQVARGECVAGSDLDRLRIRLASVLRGSAWILPLELDLSRGLQNYCSFLLLFRHASVYGSVFAIEDFAASVGFAFGTCPIRPYK